MAAKKTVAASSITEASIPATASAGGELEIASPVTESQTEASKQASDTADAVAALKAKRAAGLAKARAIKASKTLEAQAKLDAVKKALIEEAISDSQSFGHIREVAPVQPAAEEYVRVTMPLTDIFDHAHPGVQLNRHKFEPGKTYQLRGDVALEVKKRLAMFNDEQVRLLRPNTDRKALQDVNKGSQWTSRGGGNITALRSLSDVPTDHADDVILTVDF